MAKNNRREVLKRLTEQIAVTTDTKQLAELTREFSKISRLRKGKRASRKPAEQPKNSHSLRDLYTSSVFYAMSDGELVIHHLVLQIEKRQRSGELKTKAERDVFIAEVLASLPEHERAAYEALNAAEAA